MQPRAEQTRHALIVAAAALFDEHGARDTGLLEISEAAGVSKGALYFHFDSKVDLAAAVWTEARDRVHALARPLLADPAPGLSTAASFVSAVIAELRRDTVLRAGLRLEAEDSLGDKRQAPTLRQEWLHFLRHRLDAGEGGADLARLLAATTVGLEALGREDRSWWSEDVMRGLWDLLTRLTDREPASREPAPGRGADRPFTPP
ncbi:TetR family transcriptional regulator [Streptomyces sparsus]